MENTLITYLVLVILDLQQVILLKQTLFFKCSFYCSRYFKSRKWRYIDTKLFEQSNPPNDQRDRLDVYFKDATSLLKGNRLFLNILF